MRRNLFYYCLLAPRIDIFVLRAHPIHGESHNQRNTIGEVATQSTLSTNFFFIVLFSDNTNWRASGPGGLEGRVSKWKR